MKYWLVTATAVCLAGCGSSSPEADGPRAGDPGTYTRSLEDGTPVSMVIREDGSLLRTMGNQTATGTVRTEGDQICFTFAGDPAGEYCWSSGPISEDGGFTSTGPDGEELMLTYSPEVVPRGVIMEPGIYEVGDENVSYGKTEIKADGTYVDYGNDVAVGSGVWTATGERICFDPEGDGDQQQLRCWINAPADADGTFVTTREDGSQRYRVTRVDE